MGVHDSQFSTWAILYIDKVEVDRNSYAVF